MHSAVHFESAPQYWPVAQAFVASHVWPHVSSDLQGLTRLSWLPLQLATPIRAESASPSPTPALPKILRLTVRAMRAPHRVSHHLQSVRCTAKVADSAQNADQVRATHV